jgi:hypothetical protein
MLPTWYCVEGVETGKNSAWMTRLMVRVLTKQHKLKTVDCDDVLDIHGRERGVGVLRVESRLARRSAEIVVGNFEVTMREWGRAPFLTFTQPLGAVSPAWYRDNGYAWTATLLDTVLKLYFGMNSQPTWESN